MKTWQLTLLMVLFSALTLACSEGKLASPGDDVEENSDTASGDTSSEKDTTSSGVDTYGGTVDTYGGTDTNTTQTCTEGVKRCSTLGNIETCMAGAWVMTQTCDAGCENNACLAFATYGTCTEPLNLFEGVMTSGTTDSNMNPHTWTAECGVAYGGDNPTGTETVYAFDVPETAYYEFTVTPLENIYLALYVRGICTDRTSQLHDLCDGSASTRGQIKITELLGKGMHYVFVDSFDQPGRFELTVKRVLTPVCGSLTAQLPELVDLSSGPLVINADTADGFTSALASETAQNGCAGVQTAGKELLYGFSLRKPTNLALSLLPNEPASSSVSAYIRTVCDDRYSQVMCEVAVGSQMTTNVQLDAGAYYLFIDDLTESIDETQTFTLVVNAP